MLIFQVTRYRKAVEGLIARAREQMPDFTQSALARAIAVQDAYLSNVLHGRAELNADQLFSLADFFKLGPVETDYLITLLEWERSTQPLRKSGLKARLDSIRAAQLSTAKYLKAKPIDDDGALTAYYLDPFAVVVHVFLRLKKYATAPEKLAVRLGISPARLRQTLETLLAIGYIEKIAGAGYRVNVRNRHLPEDSPLCLPHQTLVRLESTRRLQSIPLKQRYNFCVTFSTNPEVKERIRAEFLLFTQRCEKWVRESADERVYQMNFDLFAWDGEE